MFGLDSIVKSALSIGASSVAGPFGGLVANILGGAASNVAQSGAGSFMGIINQLANPFQAIFGQAQSQFPAPFRPTPPCFHPPQSPFGNLGDLLKGVLGQQKTVDIHNDKGEKVGSSSYTPGNIDSMEQSAEKLLLSESKEDQLKGQKLLNQAIRLFDMLSKLIEKQGDCQAKAIAAIK